MLSIFCLNKVSIALNQLTLISMLLTTLPPTKHDCYDSNNNNNNDNNKKQLPFSHGLHSHIESVGIHHLFPTFDQAYDVFRKTKQKIWSIGKRQGFALADGYEICGTLLLYVSKSQTPIALWSSRNTVTLTNIFEFSLAFVLRPQFSDPDRSLNSKMERFKIFKVELKLNQGHGRHHVQFRGFK